jgi:hypothetical protein
MIEALSPTNAHVKEEITVSTTVKTLTSGTYANYSRALIQVQDANIRYWVTGDDPSTSSGYVGYDGDFIELSTPSELAKFKAIRDDSSDAKLAVSYFKQGEFL